MAIDAVVAYGPSLGRDLEDYWKRKITSMLGTAASNTNWAWQSFATKCNNGTFTNVGSGGTRAAASKGLTHSTGGGAGGIVVSDGSMGNSGQATNVLTSATEKYIIAGRFSVNTAVAATGTCGIGARSATNVTAGVTLMLGGVGSVSTTNFALVGSTGDSIDTGVALDTNRHDFLIHRDGTNTLVYIDDVLRGTDSGRPGADSGVVFAYAHESAANTLSTTNVWSAFACPL